MLINELVADIKNKLSDRRYKHTIGVLETADALASVYGADSYKVKLAALMHDIAREYNTDKLMKKCLKYGIEPDEVEQRSPGLLHGKVGAVIAETKYGIKDTEILNAIKYHTTGRRNMSIIEKIVFIADMVEPGRDFPGVKELRNLAYKDLDRAVLNGLESTIRYLIDKSLLIHPNSVLARNFLLMRG